MKDNSKNPITLWEYQDIDDKKLNDYFKNNNECTLRDYFTNSWSTIKPDGYCGAFSLDGQTYRILPKIEDDEEKNLTYLVYMFLKANNIKFRNEDYSNSLKNEKLTIFEILIDIYCDKLLAELSKGIYRDYSSFRENLNKMRGRWLVLEHVTRNFLNEKVYCEYDEFSEDNTLNKLFLMTAKIFKPNSESIRKKLRKIELALENVEYEQIDYNKFTFNFNRNNVRFNESTNLALLLLKHFVPNFSGGGKGSFIFLFKMHEVFERFIANTLKDIEHEFVEVSIQTQDTRTNYGGDLKIRPDIVIKSVMPGNNAKLIIDTKYKIFNNKPTQEDLYQMYAYGMCYNYVDNNKRVVLLLYPKKEHNHCEKKEFNIIGSVEETNVKIFTSEINIKFENNEVTYNSYIESIQNRIKSIKSINSFIKNH